MESEFREVMRQVVVVRFRIAPVLEVHHEIVSKPRQVRLPLTCRSDLLLEPEIKNEMQVDIGQDRADGPALWRSFFRSRNDSSHHETRVQPFADYAQDER